MAPISVETGPMFSGKSEEMINKIKRRLIGNQEQDKDFLVFKHSYDNRYGEDVIASHNGEEIMAVSLTSSLDLLEFLFNLPKI